jgi:hypothetical protein
VYTRISVLYCVRRHLLCAVVCPTHHMNATTWCDVVSVVLVFVSNQFFPVNWLYEAWLSMAIDFPRVVQLTWFLANKPEVRTNTQHTNRRHSQMTRRYADMRHCCLYILLLRKIANIIVTYMQFHCH